MALIVTICIMVITVYTVLGFKNIKVIRAELELQNRGIHHPKRFIKKEEVKDYEEDEFEN